MKSGMNRRRRIGVDFHTFDGLFQGSRSHILGLFSEAVALAPEFDFVFFLNDVERLRQSHSAFRAPNVELVRMPHWPGLLRLAIQLPLLRLRHQVDLLHVQYRIPPVAFGPCACTIHDLLFESHPQFFERGLVLQSKLTFRYSALKAQLLFSVSEFSKNEIARRYRVMPDRINVLYNGVDRQRFFPGEVGCERLRKYDLASGGYILTVGRLEPRKNHRNLLRAYALLPCKAFPLVVVGQRDFGCDGLFDLVEELGLTGRVYFLESIDDFDLPVLMRHAKAFIYPAFAEGFGMPVAEAMASGVPVVTSRTTSLPEVAGDAALLIDPTSPESIAEALCNLIENDTLCASLRDRALQRVDRFDWRLSAEKLVSAYNSFFGGEVVRRPVPICKDQA